MAEQWHEVWDALEITNDDFVRTTQERHKENVREFIEKLYEQGDILQGDLRGTLLRGL